MVLEVRSISYINHPPMPVVLTQWRTAMETASSRESALSGLCSIHEVEAARGVYSRERPQGSSDAGFRDNHSGLLASWHSGAAKEGQAVPARGWRRGLGRLKHYSNRSLSARSRSVS